MTHATNYTYYHDASTCYSPAGTDLGITYLSDDEANDSEGHAWRKEVKVTENDSGGKIMINGGSMSRKRHVVAAWAARNSSARQSNAV